MKRSSEGDGAHRFGESAYNEPNTSPAPASTAKQKKPPSPRRCRDFIRQETANAMPNIVNTFVDEAQKGSVPHFNALAKVGGFDHRSGPSKTPKRRGPSLARQLLDEVEKYEAKEAEASAAHVTSAIDSPSRQEKS